MTKMQNRLINQMMQGISRLHRKASLYQYSLVFQTPLDINSLRDGHRNTHTCRRLHRNNFKKPGAHQPVAAQSNKTRNIIVLLLLQLFHHCRSYSSMYTSKFALPIIKHILLHNGSPNLLAKLSSVMFNQVYAFKMSQTCADTHRQHATHAKLTAMVFLSCLHNNCQVLVMTNSKTR